MAMTPGLDISSLGAVSLATTFLGVASGGMTPSIELTAPVIGLATTFTATIPGLMTPAFAISATLSGARTFTIQPVGNFSPATVIRVEALPPTPGSGPDFDGSVELFINLNRYYYPAPRSRILPASTGKIAHGRITAEYRAAPDSQRAHQLMAGAV